MHGYVNASDVSDVQHNHSAVYDNASDVSSSSLDHSYLQQQSRVVYWSLMTFISTAGSVGNSLVIYVIMTRQGMRTVSNLLLVNLAAADFILLTTWLAFATYTLLLFMFDFSHSKAFSSDITTYIMRLSVYVSVYTLTLIAVVRYLVVAHPHKSKRFVARKTIGGILAVIWIVSFMFATARVSWSYVPYICFLRAVEFFTVFAYVLPLSVIATFSIRTFHRLKQPLGVTGSDCQKRNRKKAARLLVIIVMVFAVSWLPYHIHFIIYWYSSSCSGYVRWSEVVYVLGESLAISNSCVNPIIYNLASTTFRQHFLHALCCRRQRRSQ